jgi:hypothetical protein
VSPNLRLTLGCVLALAAAPFLITGWMISAVGHWILAFADRLNPSD